MKPIPVIILIALMSCQPERETTQSIRLITLDPGHFHAALVQKSMYRGVDSVVHVYAPEGNDLHLHLDRIHSYNTRKKDPTHWEMEVYRGADFFEKMVAEKKGNVVVVSGNNKKKTEYILRSLEAGLHVLADKPMVINRDDYEMLKKAFAAAQQNNLLLYDIMTERFEITTILQRELSRLPNVFGTLERGSLENPAITKESVHHFYKYVSGSVLTRPAWFMDVDQQGEGLVDVMTHLVDLVQWAGFPDQVLDTADVHIGHTNRWATQMTLEEFRAITKDDTFPAYLTKNVVNDSLRIFCNGEINYTVKGVYAKTSVRWNYKAPEDAGDTHSSIMRGTKANLVISQGTKENFIPTLYIEPVIEGTLDELQLKNQLTTIQSIYPGVDLKKSDEGWEVIIPEKYREGHEAHFARVTEKFLEYLSARHMPEWEVPNMIAKYFTTTRALELAR